MEFLVMSVIAGFLTGTLIGLIFLETVVHNIFARLSKEGRLSYNPRTNTIIIKDKKG